MIGQIAQKLGDFLFHQKLVFYGCEMKFCLQIRFFATFSFRYLRYMMVYTACISGFISSSYRIISVLFP